MAKSQNTVIHKSRKKFLPKPKFYLTLNFTQRCQPRPYNSLTFFLLEYYHLSLLLPVTYDNGK